jgi:DNA polymerase IV
MESIIFHVDVNSAFLSWEAVYRVKVLGARMDLRDLPSAIGGDIKKRHGIILAKSVPAKKYNIQTGETLGDALKKCPELVLVPPRYDLYEKCSKAFIDILREYSPCVEQYSIDEAYCDMTGTGYLYDSPDNIAKEIKDRIYEELGFTVNIGISSNKLLAKMASELRKPNLVHTLVPLEVKEKMWRLPVSELFYVGRATTKKLHNLGIHTIGELASTDVTILRAHLKKYGELIHDFANGQDTSFITDETPKNKGYGNSTTISFDVDNEFYAKMVLLALAETVSTRLRKDNVLARVVAIQIVDFEFHHASHQLTLFTATNITNEIYRAACTLFDELWDGMPIRHLGIHTSRISDDIGVRQLNFFDCYPTDEKQKPYEKLAKLDKAIDQIRGRYGIDAVKRAAFVQGPIYHMSGGISADKKKITL